MNSDKNGALLWVPLETSRYAVTLLHGNYIMLVLSGISRNVPEYFPNPTGEITGLRLG